MEKNINIQEALFFLKKKNKPKKLQVCNNDANKKETAKILGFKSI